MGGEGKGGEGTFKYRTKGSDFAAHGGEQMCGEHSYAGEVMGTRVPQ